MKANLLFGPGLEPGSAALQANIKPETLDDYVTFDNYGSTFTGENRLRSNSQFYNLLGFAARLDLNAIST
jgi:hemolysin activation/secretion protein